ncbi:MAG TPA: hypothetical protein VNZ26_06225 [Vicinamibacterales bacterium]|jgi:hypothetical protein|nr:hypothetical protein [Vicinamibacterales bacterium]
MRECQTAGAPQPPVVAALLDRIVARARIPSRAEREDVRRELWTHFEEAGAEPEAIRHALQRFGSETAVTESFRHVYRWDYRFLYLAKIAASIVASVLVALSIEALVNLRLGTQADLWRLAPGFTRGAGLSVGIVLTLVTGWEVARRPFNLSRAAAAIATYAAVCVLVQALILNDARAFLTPAILVILGYLCSRLESRPVKLALTFAAFAGAIYGTHVMLSVVFGAGRALTAAAALVAVWSSTGVILSRMDYAFDRFFELSD